MINLIPVFLTAFTYVSFTRMVQPFGIPWAEMFCAPAIESALSKMKPLFPGTSSTPESSTVESGAKETAPSTVSGADWPAV